MTELVEYRIARPSTGAQDGVPLPPIEAALYEYVMAGNGIFVRGKRRELSVQCRIVPYPIRGLAELKPYVQLHVSRVPAEHVRAMLQQARESQNDRGQATEVIFHLFVDDAGAWHVERPEQTQSPTRAKPTDDSAESSYARAFVEVHSHVEMGAWFSDLDDRDELGFRVYAILGHIFTRPELRVRVGLYGYHWDIPARMIFELPPEITDPLSRERGMDEQA